MKLSHRVLYHNAKHVDFRYPVGNENLAQQMLRIMLEKNGIGLAAPQVGLSRRLFVMQIDGRTRFCFNPEIIEFQDQDVIFQEGCLSFPGKYCTIKRPDGVAVRYQNAQGDWQQENLRGLESRCFQHELDHLNGVTMWQRQEEKNAK